MDSQGATYRSFSSIEKPNRYLTAIIKEIFDKIDWAQADWLFDILSKLFFIQRRIEKRTVINDNFLSIR
jgi:hypothetical protein